MRIPANLNSILWKTLALFCLLAAVVFGYRFVSHDRVYFFDLSYMEHNPDSLVVNCFNLRRGSFDLKIDYETGRAATAFVQADNDKSFDVPLDPETNSVTVPFSLAHPTDRFKISVPLEDGEEIRIDSISLATGRLPIYTDSLLYCLLFLAAGAGIVLLYKKADGTAMLLLLFIIAVNIPYYQRGLGLTADIRAHMQRIEGIMRGLLDHQYPVIIAPNFMNEFGELSFLYPDVFLYPFGILRIASVSMLTAYRLCMICVNAATVIIAWLSFSLISKDRVKVLTATFIITFEPYRLYNMLARGSGAGNAIASVFLPLVVAGIYLVLKGDRRWWILSVGITGVIWSHVMTLVILAGSLLILGLMFAPELVKEKKILFLVKAAGLTLIMSGGFLTIFLKCYFTDWDPAALEWSVFTDSGFGIPDVFTNPWSLFQIAGFIICVYLLLTAKKRKTAEYGLAAAMTVTGFLLYITTLTVFPWKILNERFYYLDRYTKMLQVPQRVYAISSVFFIFGIFLLYEGGGPSENQSSRSRFARERIMVILLAGVIAFGTFQAFSDYYSTDILMPDEVYGDHNSLAIKDYIPSGANEDTWRNDAGYVSDEDAVDSILYNKNGTHIDYTYVAHKEGTYANMPLLYYEWYRAKDENGKPLEVVKSEDGRVVVYLNGDGEQHEAHIYFDMGRIFSILYIGSLIFTAGFIVAALRRSAWRVDE